MITTTSGCKRAHPPAIRHLQTLSSSSQVHLPPLDNLYVERIAQFLKNISCDSQREGKLESLKKSLKEDEDAVRETDTEIAAMDAEIEMEEQLRVLIERRAMTRQLFGQKESEVNDSENLVAVQRIVVEAKRQEIKRLFSLVYNSVDY